MFTLKLESRCHGIQDEGHVAARTEGGDQERIWRRRWYYLKKCPFCAQPRVWLHFLLVHCRSFGGGVFFFNPVIAGCCLPALPANSGGRLPFFVRLFLAISKHSPADELFPSQRVWFFFVFFPGLLDLFNHLENPESKPGSFFLSDFPPRLFATFPINMFPSLASDSHDCTF